VPGRSTSSQSAVTLGALMVLEQGDHPLLRLVRLNSDTPVLPLL
jgi:hypothetical protein